jgi:hypothetical protein
MDESRKRGGRIALKNQTRLALATALMLVIAGCSSGITENSTAPGVRGEVPGRSLREVAGLD